MRISLRSGILTRQGNRAMTRNLKKGQRIGRTPKTGAELAISPRRVSSCDGRKTIEQPNEQMEHA
jgi:hypothetical protein